MSLQTTVRRAYTGGFAGQLVEDGPRRARVARILSDTIGTDANASTNHMSRAFGDAVDPSGAAANMLGVARTYEVTVGGAVFFGILGHPQHHALYGAAGDSLAASMDLPKGAEGEFFDMATGLIVELFNETTADVDAAYGDGIAYVSAADNANGLPLGAIIRVDAGADAPAGATLIPNARLVQNITIPASAAGDASFVLAMIQLTQ